MRDKSQAARGARSEVAQRGKLTVLREQHPWLDRLLRAGARYQAQYGDHYAAAITYFSVLAVVPLLMIVFSIAGFVLGGNPELLDQLRNSITSAVPNPQMSGLLNTVVDESINRAGAVGLFGLLGALYSGLGWMTNLREAVTAQWSQEPGTQSFLRRTGSDLLSLLGLGAAMGVSFGITALGGGLGAWLLGLAGVRGTIFSHVLLTVLAIALSLVASWLVFLWVLARLPRRPVNWRSALVGAAIAAIGFEILKQVIVVYLNTVTSSPAGAAFGPILGLLVFFYLTSRFVLFVAAWTASSADNPGEQPVAPGPAVIRPVVAEQRRLEGWAVTGLLGAGALVGFSWRRRR